MSPSSQPQPHEASAVAANHQEFSDEAMPAAPGPLDLFDESGTPVARRKTGIWSRIGGGSLMFAALFHIILLIIGAFWVFQITRPAEKKVDFMPSGDGGGERGSVHQVQQKKRAQITPTTSVKRVFAEGATASYAIPEQSDNFGEMSNLSSLSGGGMSGGLGGSGSGQGFGKGSGIGAGMAQGGGKLTPFGIIDPKRLSENVFGFRNTILFLAEARQRFLLA